MWLIAPAFLFYTDLLLETTGQEGMNSGQAVKMSQWNVINDNSQPFNMIIVIILIYVIRHLLYTDNDYDT